MGLVTQEDPIGIAGGLNLYGYANGDPINFSDPFGLNPLWIAFEIGASIFDAVDLAVTGARYLGGSASREELGVTALGAAAGVIGFGGGGGRAARRALGRAPTTEMGKAIESLKGFLDDGGGAWQRTSSHAEAATGRRYRGATSMEEIFLNEETGQQLVRHTIVRGDEVLHETFREVAKFGGN